MSGKDPDGFLDDVLAESTPGPHAPRTALARMLAGAVSDLAQVLHLSTDDSLDLVHRPTGIRISMNRAPELRGGAGQEVAETILLCPLPKSASVFILDALATSLGFDRVSICDHAYPSDVVPSLAPRLGYRRAVCHSHLAPVPRNLGFLNRWVTRLVVHVRDPREVVISARHHAAEVRARQGALAVLASGVPFPAWFFTATEHDQLDFLIDEIMPGMISWTEGWLDADENPDFKPEILFTRFEDFTRDNEAFLRRIARWYGLDWERADYRPREPAAGQLHFRSGNRGEWREALDPDQQARLGRMIPPRLYARFDWPAP